MAPWMGTPLRTLPPSTYRSWRLYSVSKPPPFGISGYATAVTTDKAATLLSQLVGWLE